jgi:hypothetical protein
MDKHPALFYKTLVVGVIFLFISTNSLNIGGYNLNNNSDISLITIQVVGEKGFNNWYICDVSFTFTNESENIANIKYAIGDEPYQNYTSPFFIGKDGEDIILQWYAIDYEGNCSDIDGPFIFSIDQTRPKISLTYEVIGGNQWQGWDFEFTADATDAMSGMDRVEFYFNNELQETVYGPGPDFVWLLEHYYPIPNGVWKAIAYDKAGHSETDEILDPCKNYVFKSPIHKIKDNEKNTNESFSSISSSKEILKKEHNFNIKLPSGYNLNEGFDPGYIIVVLNRKMGNNGWIVSNATIPVFYESDRIEKVYIQLNNGSWILYTNPLVISNDGSQLFSWYVVDFDGNSSTPDSISFKIDRTNPEINLIRKRYGINEIKYIANVYDNISNVDRVVFSHHYYDFFSPHYVDYDFPYEWIRKRFFPEFVVTAIVYDKAGNSAMDMNHAFSKQVVYSHQKNYQFPLSTLRFKFLEGYHFLEVFLRIMNR